MTYKVQIGVFKGTWVSGKDREFTPVFEEGGLSESQIIEKLSAFVEHWRPDMLEEWLHKPGRGRTFFLDADLDERRYGYRVIQEEDGV